MKKTDISTPIGFILGIALMVIGMYSDQGYSIFWDPFSVVITIGGSFAALLMSIPMSDAKKIGKVFIQSYKESSESGMELISSFSDLSKKARREGLLSLEDEINNLNDDFMKKGLQMVVDGIEPETIRDILELEIAETEDRHMTGASMFATWGVYAPAFGMLGTLIGLIQMLGNLSDASTIASGMGKALITTIYGSILGNLFCNPTSDNLAKKAARETKVREMMLEGILAIQSGVNPRIVEEKLVSYLEPKDRLAYIKKNSENSEGVA